MISSGKKKPDRIICAGGREFRLYKYYDDSLHEELINLPNFQESPEYTAEGRPFALAVQESCPMGKSDDPDDPDPGDCGGCGWFHREEAFAIIGVCMCDTLKRTDLARESKEEGK